MRYEDRPWKVMRDCCTSGNCLTCSGKAPFGVTVRVEQMRCTTKAQAEEIAGNWSRLKATVHRSDETRMPTVAQTSLMEAVTQLKRHSQRLEELAVVFDASGSREALAVVEAQLMPLTAELTTIMNCLATIKRGR